MENYLTKNKQSLSRKYRDKKNIVVVGLWHMGCVYAASFANAGFKVVGFDSDKKIISQLKKGVPPIYEPKLTEIIRKNINKRLSFSSEKEVMKNSNYIFITYDLLVDDNDLIKVEIIHKTFTMLSKLISDNTTVVISSVVPIGTSRILVNLLKRTGVKNSEVIYFPENLRLGQAFTSFLTPDRIILGSNNARALNQFKEDFSFFKCPFITMSLESAEMAKHALNSYLATCISFSSELSDLSEKTGVNMLDVVKALRTDKRVSVYAPINPGLGFTGGTLARDIQILRKIAKDYHYQPKLLNAVYAVNQNRLSRLLLKINRVCPSLKDKTVGILGLTYKPRTDTLRRSMSLELASSLKDQSCRIKAFDPAVKNQISSHSFIKVCSSVNTFFKNLDMVILMTEWPQFLRLNLPKLSSLMKNRIIIDTKNFLDYTTYKNNGFSYFGMGIEYK